MDVDTEQVPVHHYPTVFTRISPAAANYFRVILAKRRLDAAITGAQLAFDLDLAFMDELDPPIRTDPYEDYVRNAVLSWHRIGGSLITVIGRHRPMDVAVHDH